MKLPRLRRIHNNGLLLLTTCLFIVCTYRTFTPQSLLKAGLNVEDVCTTSFTGMPSLPNITKILITTVGRSGSSVFGQYLSQISNQSYYVFEPFHRYAATVAQRNTEIQTENFLDKFRGNVKEFFRLAHAYFTCKVPLDLQTKVYNHIFARITRRDSTLQPKDPLAPEAVQFNELCPISNLKVIKAIRLVFFPIKYQAQIYKQLLDAFPDLVVIALYRDPRKVYLSSLEAKFDVSDIREICSHQLSLHQSLGYLKNEMPTFPHKNRIIVVKYEDFSKDPLQATNNISNLLLGRPLDPKGAKWISTKWKKPRKKSKYQVTQNITREASLVSECRQLAKIMGYYEFD